MPESFQSGTQDWNRSNSQKRGWKGIQKEYCIRKEVQQARLCFQTKCRRKLFARESWTQAESCPTNTDRSVRKQPNASSENAGNRRRKSNADSKSVVKSTNCGGHHELSGSLCALETLFYR